MSASWFSFSRSASRFSVSRATRLSNHEDVACACLADIAIVVPPHQHRPTLLARHHSHYLMTLPVSGEVMLGPGIATHRGSYRSHPVAKTDNPPEWHGGGMMTGNEARSHQNKSVQRLPQARQHPRAPPTPRRTVRVCRTTPTGAHSGLAPPDGAAADLTAGP
jgi:hypothetical protein